MVKIWFPEIYIPALIIKEGSFLDVWILGIHIVVPPSDIVFWRKITLVRRFVIFDSDWILKPVRALIAGVPKAVWDHIYSPLKKWFDTIVDHFGKIGKVLEGIPKAVLDLCVKVLEKEASDTLKVLEEELKIEE